VSAGRLGELEETIADGPRPEEQPWHLSVLVGQDRATDLSVIAALQQRVSSPPPIRIDAIELRAEAARTINDTMPAVPDGLEVYFELPIERDPAELLLILRRLGGRAKVRTGGVTSDAFPSTGHLARFIQACIRANVPFKATAGLHHPLRAEYRLTYEEHSAKGIMFGFVNLFLAAALVRRGISEADTCRILEESSPEAFRVEDGAISWRDYRLSTDELDRGRESLVSFGSCSFTEPIAELQALRWLDPSLQRV
jgi:hypothetical protein